MTRCHRQVMQNTKLPVLEYQGSPCTGNIIMFVCVYVFVYMYTCMYVYAYTYVRVWSPLELMQYSPRTSMRRNLFAVGVQFCKMFDVRD